MAFLLDPLLEAVHKLIYVLEERTMSAERLVSASIGAVHAYFRLEVLSVAPGDHDAALELLRHGSVTPHASMTSYAS